MGRQTGDFNRFGKIETDTEGNTVNPADQIGADGEDAPEIDDTDTDADADAAIDPLDHDGNGKKGGSEKGSKSTRSKGAAKAKAEEAAPAADAEPSAEAATDTNQTDAQPEETPVEEQETPDEGE